MAVEDAFRAMREFTTVVPEAGDMATAGATGKVLEETIKHAEELLTIIDEELMQFDPTGQVAARAAAPELRGKLESLREKYAQPAKRKTS